MDARLLFTPQEAADTLGVSIVTIRRAFYSGRLPGVKIGKLLRFRREAIEAFIEACAVPAGGRK
ncbi:MAG TPA: helix-turn-helix domain-containing protein [Rectinemataceae bacterium]|nr:helix-turn-helix domain-containing protein [Rectinemataceae bacterium]